jgi:uncharacterized protein YggU (UPF0235/DUF167 family)
MSALILGTHRLGVRLETRITPRASRNAIEGIREGRLVVKVTASPVDEAANAAVIETVSRALDLSWRHVTIVAGDHSRMKSLALSGVSADKVRERLSAILGHSV